jgi:hypothetical protein
MGIQVILPGILRREELLKFTKILATLSASVIRAINVHQTTPCNNPEDRHFHTRRQKLKSRQL